MYYSMSWQKVQNNYTRRYSDTATRINIWCEMTGCSRNRLAKACAVYGHDYKIGFTPSLVYGYANGKFQPKMDKLTVMARVMGVSLAWLTGYGSDKLTHYKKV